MVVFPLILSAVTSAHPNNVKIAERDPNDCIIRGGHLRHGNTYLEYGYHTLTDTIEECKESCAAREDCQWFTYRNDRDQLTKRACWHFSDPAYDAAGFGTALGRDQGGSGPKKCTSEYVDSQGHGCVYVNAQPPAKEFLRRPWYPSEPDAPGWEEGTNLNWFTNGTTHTSDECQWYCAQSVWEKSTTLDRDFVDKINLKLGEKYIPYTMPEQKACKWYRWHTATGKCELYTQEPNTLEYDPKYDDSTKSGPSVCEENKPMKLSNHSTGKKYAKGTVIESEGGAGRFFHECDKEEGCTIHSLRQEELDTHDWPTVQENCNCGETTRNLMGNQDGNFWDMDYKSCKSECLKNENCESFGVFKGEFTGFCVLRDRKCLSEDQICYKRVTDRFTRGPHYNLDKSCDSDSDCKKNFPDESDIFTCQVNPKTQQCGAQEEPKKCLPKRCDDTTDCPQDSLCMESTTVNYKTCRVSARTELKRQYLLADKYLQKECGNREPEACSDVCSGARDVKNECENEKIRECEAEFLHLAKKQLDFEIIEKVNGKKKGANRIIPIEEYVESIEPGTDYGLIFKSPRVEKCMQSLGLLLCENRFDLENGPNMEEFNPEDSFVRQPTPKGYDELPLKYRLPICRKRLAQIMDAKRLLAAVEAGIMERLTSNNGLGLSS